MGESTTTDAFQESWLAPTPLARQRVQERAGKIDRPTAIAGAIVAAVLLATAILHDALALAPLGVLLGTLALAPPAIARSADPARAELAAGLLVTIAMAAGAGLTGGTSSPIVFLLPIGVAMNALRGSPASIVACSLVTGAVFLTATLLAEAAAVASEPLPMLAALAMLVGVTVGCVALTVAEIGHRRASIADPLTGLLNRQALDDRFEELRQQALISRAPITFVLFDLDHFKAVNDEHGHDVGDRLLREIAYEVRKSLRRFELVYRVGGEEFLLVLPGMTELEGEATAERLRGAIEGVRLQSEIGVTASFGVSSDSGEEIDFASLYRRADRALYRAKGEGRDRVGSSRGAVELEPA